MGSDAERRRILVVDDDPQTAELARAWYKGKPVEILAASNGEEGFELAQRSSPHLILLDIRMPGADGISIARRLKSTPATMAIPVMLLTACRDIGSKVDAFKAGADDYVTKPFAFAEVDARIGAMVKKSGKLVGMQSEIESLKETNKDLEQLLVVDEKTGLYNFRHFQSRLREEWQRASRYDTPLSLIFLDIDNLKPINDTHGHPAGDRALKEFAMLVAGGARSTDTAARYGGDEFAMILPHTDAPMARRVAERIRLAVEQFVFLEEEHSAHITVSIGVATYPAAGVDSMDALIRAADSALYAAKEQGRNRVVSRNGNRAGSGLGDGSERRVPKDPTVRAEGS